MRIIAISNHKGGTGKTTTCANLGVALTEMNKRVLTIDLDPQASLSVSLGINTNSLEKTIYNALLERGFKVENAIIKARENLDLLPSNRELAAAEVILIQETGGELVLRKMLEKIQNSYDYILIDCPPNLGKLTINALVASDEVIIPVSCSFLDIRALGQLLETVETI
ncbi:ParA family protein, partial [Candidatus Aerophobetes bacterium]|nr:ParA family protein [Candidatus Aerophobetes bacterium]